MVDQNTDINEKIPSKVKKEKIIEWLKSYEPLTISLIKSRLHSLGLGASDTSIKKDYIDTLLAEKLIFAFKKKTKKNRKSKILLIAYGKKWTDGRRGRYYVYTPRSADFYQDLISIIDKFSNKQIFMERINKILSLFQYIEIISRYEKNKVFSDKLIKKVMFDRLGKIPNKEQISAVKNGIRLNMLSVNSNIRVQIVHKDGMFADKDGKEFLKITDDHFVNADRLKEFLDLPRKRSDNMMVYIANKKGFDKEHATKPMMQKLTYLFVEIERAKYLKEKI